MLVGIFVPDTVMPATTVKPHGSVSEEKWIMLPLVVGAEVAASGAAPTAAIPGTTPVVLAKFRTALPADVAPFVASVTDAMLVVVLGLPAVLLIL